ncbi:hypothetical protein [Butyrivibrio sp.]|uniref:hypothetical protein n=1 Tax=Butyrivibrio sp. TaxID=28121 RepID=UPI0025BF6E5B|nr:hypothetical protein [Butyrivibrio sp.]MBQ9302743.1 hypothetical protein [Butyrivibrio sp.]
MVLGIHQANLVKEGRKFGTASCYELYELEDELDEFPKAGDYSVILDTFIHLERASVNSSF